MDGRKPSALKWLKLTADQMKATGEFFIHDLDELTGKFLTEPSSETETSDYLVSMIRRRLERDFEMVADRAISMLQDLKTQMKVEAQQGMFSSRIPTAKVTRGTSVSLPTLSGDGSSVSGCLKANGGGLKMNLKGGITAHEDSASAGEERSGRLQIKSMAEFMSQEAPSDSKHVSTMTSDLQLALASSSNSPTNSVSNRTQGEECPAKTTSITDEEGNLDKTTSTEKKRAAFRKVIKEKIRDAEQAISQTEFKRTLSESRSLASDEHGPIKCNHLVKQPLERRPESTRRNEGNEVKETRKSPRGHTPTGATPEGLFRRTGRVKKIKLEDSQ